MIMEGKPTIPLTKKKKKNPKFLDKVLEIQ